jgi:curved DNA-binding protein CbpA
MTLYEELELSADCTADDIKQQYRILAMKHHPDHGGEVEKFQRIKLAYEVLIDPERRSNYDKNKTTGESTDIRAEAITQLAGIFFSIMPNFNCSGGNLIESMTQAVESIKSKVQADDMMCDIYIHNITIVKEKLRLKNPNKEDIVMSFIDKQLETRKQDKIMFARRIELAAEMLLILADYQYGFLELVSQEPIVSENEQASSSNT